jgi:hypothetical protein
VFTFSLSQCLLFGVVVANLTVGAQQTRKWYREHVQGYPRDRPALLPGAAALRAWLMTAG